MKVQPKRWNVFVSRLLERDDSNGVHKRRLGSNRTLPAPGGASVDLFSKRGRESDLLC